MKNGLGIAIVLAVAAVVIVGALLYFSPYQSCVRALQADGTETGRAQVFCKRGAG